MRSNFWSGSLLAIGATTLLAASAAFGQCNNTCPGGGIQQNDACGGLNPDPNGGCNFSPVQYQDIGAIVGVSSKTTCGTVGTWGDANRDLDWYRFSLSQPAKLKVTLNHKDASGNPVTNATIFIINGDDCDTQVVEYAVASGSCPFVSDEVALPAGNHVVIITVNSFAPDPPACPVTYSAKIEVTALIDAACGGTAECTQVHPTGGCNNLACCDQVCTFNPDCCSTGWDQTCVDLAVKLCGLFIYDCPAVPGAPANNCATAAASLTCGAEAVAFNTTNATTDGPPNAGCTYGKDIWYILQFDGVGGGELELDVNTPTFDSTVALYALGASPTFDPNDLPNLFIGCVDANGPGGEAVVLIDAVEGDWYLIQVAGFDGGQGAESGAGDISTVCRRVIYNTGNTNAVKFDSTNMGNYTNTNLGWSSGNLNGTTSQQRWACQAFTVGALPSNTIWRVTAIHGYGFEATGFTNEQLCWRIWKRTSLATPPNPPNDFPPDDAAAAFGCVPMPAPFDIVGGAANEDFEITTNFTLKAGDYWLTIYANNTNGTISNWAWFTNSANGIGYTVPPGATNGMWRSSLYPTPGFVAYTLPMTTIMQQDGLDPAQLYTTGFRLIGTKESSGPPPCPSDFNGDGIVNGADLGLQLAAWGSCPAPCIFDLNGDGLVDGADLGLELAAWGPCPTN